MKCKNCDAKLPGKPVARLSKKWKAANPKSPEASPAEEAAESPAEEAMEQAQMTPNGTGAMDTVTGGITPITTGDQYDDKAVQYSSAKRKGIKDKAGVAAMLRSVGKYTAGK